MITLNGLRFNRRVKAKYIKSKDNSLSDALSRNLMARFRKIGPRMNECPNTIHPDMWLVEKLWIN